MGDQPTHGSEPVPESANLCANPCAVRAESPAHSAPSRAQNAHQHDHHDTSGFPLQVRVGGRASYGDGSFERH